MGNEIRDQRLEISDKSEIRARNQEPGTRILRVDGKPMVQQPVNKNLQLNGQRSVAGHQQMVQQQDNKWAILKAAMIRDLPKKEVFNILLVSVARAFADLNVKDISTADREYLVNELTDNVLKYYPSIRLSEIPEAFALGIRGKFGEFFGLSVITFERFIAQYLLSEKRTTLVKQLPADDNPRKVPDAETQFATAKHNALQALQRLQNGKDTETIATSVYTFLDRLQLMQYTVAEKNDMMADATRQLIAELKYKLMLARPDERPGLKTEMEDYTLAITAHAPVNDRQLALVKMRAKKLALDAFLNNILLEQTDLAALIESRKGLFIR